MFRNRRAAPAPGSAPPVTWKRPKTMRFPEAAETVVVTAAGTMIVLAVPGRKAAAKQRTQERAAEARVRRLPV